MFRNFFIDACFVFLGLLALSFAAHSASGTVKNIPVLILDDVIVNPIVSEFIEEGIREAEEQKAPCLILQLDTPGGLLSSTRTIVKNIMNAKIPVIVYVAPAGSRAGSAGVFITYASHVAVMAPSTNIGAAHPVQIAEPQRPSKESDFRDFFKKGDENGGKKGGNEKEDGDFLSEKVMNDTLAWIKGIAEERGRNASWAEKAIKKSVSVTAPEALRLKVIDFIAEDDEDLLRQLEGRSVTVGGKEIPLHVKGFSVDDKTMSARQGFLYVLMNPNIAYLLMSLGFIGLLFELTHPGVWFPGVMGFISLILAFYSFQTLPTNYAGFALIFLAMGLFVAEALVTSFGFLALGGMVCMVLGSIILVDSPFELMRISWSVIIPVVLSTTSVFVFLTTLALRAQRSKKEAGVISMIGVEGMADTEVNLEGKVIVMGEIWDAVAEQPIAKGARIRVWAMEGLKLKVESID
ncbi:MAG: hypothetical protein A3I75_04875 [Deltaproteobacteria bacterium RIFCSPLOWO2_02_FULL_50_16]|nr:MAG: hypothetical protein A3B79_02400 [Deltaproteobacteria bacterium RIFCSPHIGHO2_02_FULL_50_15]OGQ56757.1 MAG: hypothetical protein A3I75_04875 [Deltaproteobacteria bacterium RIFCSPLOWO2_02_FULL_50_16]OGQ67828.1 MAG: hypothetical protein A3F89_02395 [Deltaproteobacteria bacterium RIFCSPLOWO2_12_FULL_50_11]